MRHVRQWSVVAVALLVLLAGLALWQWPQTERAAQAQQTVEVSGPAAIKAFDDWAQRYIAARSDAQSPALSASERNGRLQALATLEAEGEKLAKARRTALAAMIESDPEQALASAVNHKVRAAAPESVRKHFEQPFNGMGQFGVIATREDTPAGPKMKIRRSAEVDGKHFEAFTFGSRLRDKTIDRTSMHGIAIDGKAAIAPERVRVLAKGEAPSIGKKIADSRCPVSGKPKVDPAKPEVIEEGDDDSGVIVESGDTVYYLCSHGHIETVQNGLIVKEAGGTSGGTVAMATTPSGYTTGPKTVLYIRVKFSDQTTEPQSESSVISMMNSTNQFFQINSYGQTDWTTTVTPVYTLPNTAQWYIDNDTSGFASNVLTDARAVAANPSDPRWASLNTGLQAYNYLNYTFEAVRYSGGPGGFSGQAYVGGRGCWMKSSSAGVAIHEFGHNLGLWHANYWSTTDNASPIGPGSMSEYGDSFDTMGAAGGGNQHFNAAYKYELTWLLDSGIQVINSSGTYRVTRHDSQTATGIRGLRVPRSPRDYWIEYRQLYTSNQWMMNGAGIRWKYNYSSSDGSHLLDMTPGSPDGKNDSPLVIGQTFSDNTAGIHITPVAKGGTSPNEWLDVQVNIGNFGSNNAPTLSLNASTLTASTGQAITFTATASDPDGDTVYYYWDFGDKSVSQNQATVNKSFSAVGKYRVRCTVSDGKGKTTSQSVVVTIGAATSANVSGIVRDGDGNPVADALVTNGVSNTAANYRYARTDTDGTYTLAGVPAGSYTISAWKERSTVTADGFVNPVTVASTDIGNINFVAVPTRYRISGTVRDIAGTGVANVLVSNGVTTERTASNGTFTLYNVDPGSYTLTATRTGYQFSNRSVTVDNTNLTAQDISEVAITMTGDIQTSTGSVFTAGTVTVTDGVRSTTSTISGTGGNQRNRWTMNVPAGQWNLRGTLTGYSVTPSGWTNPVTASTTARNFRAATAATTYSIAGTVTDRSQALIGADITVTLSGATVATGKTDSRGNYFINGLAAGAYVVTPSSPGLTFTPATRSVTISTSNATGQNFATTLTNAVPTVTASVNPTSTTSNNVQLSAVGNDDGGEQTLTYQWSSVTVPSGATITYDIGGPANAAKSTKVTVNRAGTYTLRVTARDIQNAAGTSDVTFTVTQVATSIAITPTNPSITINGTQQFAASILDQFNQPMATQPTFAWSASSGSIDPTGLYTPSVVGTHTVTVAGDGRQISTTIAVGYPPGPGTGITREVWNTITGNTVANLTADSRYIAGVPDSTTVLTSLFEAPSNVADNYGQRIRGYFIAPATGTYVFNIASDDASQLFLSSTENASGKVQIASVSGAVGSRSWTQTTSQTSAGVSLVAGQRYYIEALHKEGTGSDHVAVGVTLPGGVFERPIPAHRLDPIAGSNVIVTIAATDATATETLPAAPAFAGVDESTSVAAAPDTGVFTLTRTGDVTQALTVNVTIGGTAGNGTDYDAIATTATFAAGSSTATIIVNPIDDAAVEPSETVIVSVAAGNGYTLGSPNSATVTIGDNDVPNISASIAATTPAAAEGGATGQFTITLSGTSPTDVTVNFAVSGTAAANDYASLGTGVVIPAGQTSATLTVTPTNDTVFEGSETVIVTLASGTGYTLGTPANATVTIADNDSAPSATIAATTANAAEGGATGQFTVTLSNASNSATTVNYTVNGTATSDSDYTALTGSVTIAAGSTNGTIAVTAVDDNVFEGSETVVATLASGTGYTVGATNSGTVTIADNDAAPTATIAATTANANETGPTNGVFTITLNRASSSATTVNYTVGGTATSGSDYTALAGSVQIAAGSTTGTVTVTPVDDTTTESSETVVVTLASGTGYSVGTPGNATVNIADNDTLAAAPVLVSAVSRRTHGAMAYNISLPLAGTGVECRSGGTTTLVLTFDKTITAGTATVTLGTATVGTVTFSGSTMTIPLTGVTDVQRVRISLSNLAGNGTATNGTGTLEMRFLVGDVSGDGRVNSTDTGNNFRKQIGKAVTASNFRYDIDCSNAINATDQNLATANANKLVP